MAQFYIEKKANEAGEHLVHSSTCASLPAEENMQYLGAFSNANASVYKATNSNRYFKVTTCPKCIAA